MTITPKKVFNKVKRAAKFFYEKTITKAKLAKQCRSLYQETYWIDPREVQSATRDEFNIFENSNKVRGGDWDLDNLKFEEMDFYKSYKDRILNQTAWSDTPYYKWILNQIAQGSVKWGCKTRQDLDARCKQLDEIYKDMKENGYKKNENLDEVSINIGRDGQLLFNNGRHRLTFAKLLNLDKIPVKITVRHKKWENFKRDILLYARNQPARKIYAPLNHVDLENIPAYHPGRFDLMKNNLALTSGKVLDIGAHWGWFCHKFEELGFDCYAVENLPDYWPFLEKLKTAANKRFKIVKEDVFDYHKKDNQFDVVIAMSIFHWFIRDKETFEKFKELLRHLDMKVMFFQPHSAETSNMTNSYKNFSQEEFVKFIIENSCLNNYKCIGQELSRNIYMIYK